MVLLQRVVDLVPELLMGEQGTALLLGLGGRQQLLNRGLGGGEGVRGGGEECGGSDHQQQEEKEQQQVVKERQEQDRQQQQEQQQQCEIGEQLQQQKEGQQQQQDKQQYEILEDQVKQQQGGIQQASLTPCDETLQGLALRVMGSVKVMVSRALQDACGGAAASSYYDDGARKEDKGTVDAYVFSRLLWLAGKFNLLVSEVSTANLSEEGVASGALAAEGLAKPALKRKAATGGAGELKRNGKAEAAGGAAAIGLSSAAAGHEELSEMPFVGPERLLHCTEALAGHMTGTQLLASLVSLVRLRITPGRGWVTRVLEKAGCR
jgi:hypothetical protein